MKPDPHGGQCRLQILLVFACMLFMAGVIHAQPPTTTKIQPIQIEITTHLGDEQTFVAGDIISFLLNLDKEAYLLVIYQDAAGNLIQLLPNRESQKGRYQAGLFISLPDEKAPFRFKVQPPFGDETLWAFASDVPPPKLKGKELQNGLKLLKLNLKTLRQTLRTQNQKSYGETRLLIHTRAR